MSDNDEFQPNLFPEVLTVPRQVLEQWFKIPEHEYVNMQLTRKDLDQFFIAFEKMITAQVALQNSYMAYTNGDNEAANLHYH